MVLVVSIAGVIYAILLAVALNYAKSDVPQALLALLSKPQSHETWKVLTDLEAPIDSETGPTSSMSCMIQGGMRVGLWVESHLPGWLIKEWRCIPVTEVQSFLKQHAGADI